MLSRCHCCESSTEKTRSSIVPSPWGLFSCGKAPLPYANPNRTAGKLGNTCSSTWLFSRSSATLILCSTFEDTLTGNQDDEARRFKIPPTKIYENNKIIIIYTTCFVFYFSRFFFPT